jgi:nucleotide-binding universal stress UspA family protein
VTPPGVGDPRAILVPVDFEPASTKAIELAERLEGPLQAEIVLVHVHHPPVFPYADIPAMLLARMYERSEIVARRELEELAHRHGVDAIFREGTAAAEILSVIDALRPVLVVMGTHGRRGLSRLFVGSVTERVIRQSEAPVLTVRPTEPRARRAA